MSDCDHDRIERLAARELDSVETAAATEHLRTCAACAKELRWLEAERQLIFARGEGDEVLPAFASFSATNVRPRRWGRRALWVGAAVAALVLMTLLGRSSVPSAPVVLAPSAICSPVQRVRSSPRTSAAGFSSDRGPMLMTADGPRAVVDLCL